MAPETQDRRRFLATALGVASAVVGAGTARGAPEPTGPSSAAAPATGLVGAASDPSYRMTVPVLLNGQGPYTFVVDTGANRSVIATEVAGLLALPDGGPSAVHGIAGVEVAQTAQVQSLAVGSVSLHELRLPLLPQDRIGAQGLLGVDVLSNQSVTLDFLDSALQIHASRGDLSSRDADTSRLYSVHGEGSTVTVPARYRSGQLIIIDASVGDISVQAFLDSGSEDTVANLALRTEALTRKPELTTRLTSVQLLSATGQTAQGDLCPLPPLRFGSLTLPDVSAVFADLHTFELWGLKGHPALLVGMDVMRRFDAVDLDFGHRQVRFHMGGRRG